MAQPPMPTIVSKKYQPYNLLYVLTKTMRPKLSIIASVAKSTISAGTVLKLKTMSATFTI